MWIFTKHGFFSAVCARQGSGKHGQGVDWGASTVSEYPSRHEDIVT